MEFETLRYALGGVSAYREIARQPELTLVRSLLDKLAAGDGAGAMEDYARLFYTLRSAGYTGLGTWLYDQLRYTESPYALLAEQGGADPALEGAARHDVALFTRLCEL
ncbi:ATP-binding protein, partial [Pseudoflavonifractor phocaeensis]|nr:ATP-binding protein [Pseudoflavonifractor phocaeensis]